MVRTVTGRMHGTYVEVVIGKVVLTYGVYNNVNENDVNVNVLSNCCEYSNYNIWNITGISSISNMEYQYALT